MQTHRVRLGQFEQGNAAHGHSGEVEAVLCVEAMTSRRFPAPWRADKITGGYVRKRSGARAHLLRDSEAEALQAKVLTKDEARRIAVNPTPP
jgi:hypothetical protein